MSHDAPTVSARFVYGFTTTHAGSATELRMLKNAHDAVMIRYGATTVQAGSATAASRSICSQTVGQSCCILDEPG